MPGIARQRPALDSQVVHNTGDESIAGEKTFSAVPLINARPEVVDMNQRFYNLRDGDVAGEKLEDALTAVDAGSGNPLVNEIIFSKPGDYGMDHSIVIERGDFRLHGMGGVRFVIDATDLKTLFVHSNTPGVYRSNIEFDHFTMYDPDPIGHTGLQEQSHGIVLKRGSDFKIHDITFDSMGDECVDTGHSRKGQIFLNRFRNGSASAGGSNGAVGLNCATYLDLFLNTFYEQTQGQAIRIEIADVPDPGVEVGHHRIFRNRILDHNILTSAITFASGANGAIVDVSIENNDILGCLNIPIVIAVAAGAPNARDIRVIGNVIRGGGTYDPAGSDRGAISFNDDRTENAVAKDNEVASWGTAARQHGIRMFSGVCSNNVVRDVADCGIRGENGTSGYLSLMEGNVVQRAGLMAASGSRAGLLIQGNWRAKDNDVRSSLVGESLVGTSAISINNTLLSNTTKRAFSGSATSAQVVDLAL